MDFKNATYDEILTWCDANGKLDWLEEKLNAGLSFIAIKQSFFRTFMAEAIPPKKEKAPSMKDKLAALKAAKVK